MTSKAKAEANELIQEMKSHIGGNAANQFAPMARLLILITDDMDRQTRRIVRLTWMLVALTLALLIFTVALYEDAHAQTQREQTQNLTH